MQATELSAPRQKGVRGHILLKPHLHRYVQWKENLERNQALIVPGYSPIATVFDLLLTNKTNYLASLRRQCNMRQYTARLPFEICGSRVGKNFIFIADHMVVQFNNFLHNLLHDDLLQRAIQAKLDGRQEREAIEDFLDDSGLYQWLDFEAVKKAQYRLRTARNMPTMRGHFIMRQRQGAPRRGVQLAIDFPPDISHLRTTAGGPVRRVAYGMAAV